MTPSVINAPQQADDEVVIDVRTDFWWGALR